MKRYAPRSCLRVVWTDASGHGAHWTAVSEEDCQPHEVVSVGQLLFQDDHSLTLVLSVDEDTNYVDASITIPVQCIKATPKELR